VRATGSSGVITGARAGIARRVVLRRLALGGGAPVLVVPRRAMHPVQVLSRCGARRASDDARRAPPSPAPDGTDACPAGDIHERTRSGAGLEQAIRSRHRGMRAAHGRMRASDRHGRLSEWRPACPRARDAAPRGRRGLSRRGRASHAGPRRPEPSGSGCCLRRVSPVDDLAAGGGPVGNPDRRTLIRIADVLGIPAEWLGVASGVRLRAVLATTSRAACGELADCRRPRHLTYGAGPRDGHR